MAAAVKDIEKAIIAELKAKLAYLKKVGSLSDILTKKADAFTSIVPAAYVTYTGGKFSEPGMNYTMQDKAMRFYILVVARNYASQEKLLHGSGSKLGIYEIVEEIMETLRGKDLGLSIRPLIPVSEQSIDGDQGTIVYGIIFTTSCRV